MSQDFIVHSKWFSCWFHFKGYFSDFFAVNFFPPDQDFEHSLTLAFVIFGVGFLARPIGGVIIGTLGDKDVNTEVEGTAGVGGRARAVKISILLMALPTFALGCLPTYQTVGSTATVLLVVIRLLQGFSAGGQLMSSVVYTMECAPTEHWGVWGASVYTASSLGVTFGSAMSYILRRVLTEEEILDWGWRIPFWFALLGTIPSCYLKNKKMTQNRNTIEGKSDESGQGEDIGMLTMTSRTTASPKVDTGPQQGKFWTRSNARGLISCILVTCMPSALYYVIFIWLVTYMESIRDPPIPHAFAINTAMGLLSLPLTMMGGWLVDSISISLSKYCRYNSYKCIMCVAVVGNAVLAPLLLHTLSLSQYSANPFVALAFQTTLTIVMVLFQGAMLPFLMTIFPQRIRLTSMAFGYNIGVCICGGFAPSVATYLVRNPSHDATSVGYMLSILSILSGIGVYLGPTERWKEQEAIFEHNDEIEMI